MQYIVESPICRLGFREQGLGHSLHAGSTKLIDRISAGLFGDTGPDRSLPGHVLALAGSHYIAHPFNPLVDAGGATHNQRGPIITFGLGKGFHELLLVVSSPSKKSCIADTYHVKPIRDGHHAGVAFPQPVDGFLDIFDFDGPVL